MSARRGFALLLVLAGTLVVLAGTTLAIALLLDTRRHLAATASDDHLLDALVAGEQLSLQWLRSHAHAVVLSPDDGSIALINDRWRCQQGDGELTVQLYDACSMIPARCAGVSGNLRTALPPGWSGVVLPDIPFDLQSEPSDWLETIALPHEFSRFPIASNSAPVVDWSTMGTIVRGPQPDDHRTARAGLAMIVSPHSDGGINLNTAPESVLRSAFQLAGLGGVDEILQRRRRGLTITAAPEVPSQAVGFRFVTTSKHWNAHITAQWNATRRSWWVVITGNPMEWRIVQRHDADR